MRITNKIMQNNSLSNINFAKVAEDSLSSQVSSGKKIVRPSDDPIVAIRSLRLRSSVVEITQYYSRNAKDADAWLKTTDDAMQQVSDVITDMIRQYDKGANEYLTSADRNIILEQLKALKNEVYATGDADYAGRYVFTGYRTESSLMFSKNTDKLYEITEQLTAGDLKTGSYVKTNFEAEVKKDDGSTETVNRDLKDLQEGTQTDYVDVTEDDIVPCEYYRIRLAYNNCKEGKDDDTIWPTITYCDPPGTKTEKTINTTREAKSTDASSPYIAVGDDEVVYLSDTGELLLGKNVYKSLSGVLDNPLSADKNEGEIRVTYQKEEFKEGDLRPEHYFYCRTPRDEDDTLDAEDAEEEDKNDIIYNKDYLDPMHQRQVIEYDVGFNQRIQVNTIAEECFNPNVVREVDDMVQALENIQKIENVTTTLKKMLDNTTGVQKREELEKQIAAANKAFTYAKEEVQKKFKSGITVMQGFLDEVNVAVTDCGARGSRLELVTSRLCSQKTTFETLKSENEDVDLSEAVVQLTSAEMTYEAALKATGKIMQTNLMDFI